MTEAYYPPRARWYNALWRCWYPLKRRLYLYKLPKDSLSRALLGAVLPGWAFIWTGQTMLGVILGAMYCLSAALFLIWIGYPVSNFALTAMISIHAGSILRIQESIGLLKRIVYSVATFLAVTGFVYVPLRGWMERHWIVPLTVGGRVILIRAGHPRGSIQRGDWIAYRLAGIYNYGVRAYEGCTLGRVWAVAGDEVVFDRQEFRINGEPHPRLSHMPAKGTLQVRQACWFIWPDMRVTSHGDAGEAGVTDAMMQLAIVPESSYVGVPFRRWLWRRQTVP